MPKPHTDHDKLFKSALQDIKSAREFFENFLPPEIFKEIDLGNLRLDTTNYVDLGLKETFADIVLDGVFFKNNNTLILLLDHKSSINRWLIPQILGYINRIFFHDFQGKRPYRFVLPIIIYHGNRKSKPKPLHSYFKDLAPHLQKFVPSIDFVFINLGTIPNEKLLKLSDDALLKSTFLALKNIENSDFIRTHFEDLVKFFHQNDNYSDFLPTILLYLYRYSSLENKEIDSLMDLQIKKNIKMKQGAGVAAKELINEGITQGKLEKTIEVVRDCWAEGLTVEVTSKISKLSMKEVKNYFLQFEKEKKKL